jgi:hypothetical protein
MRHAIWMLATLCLGMNAVAGVADPFRSVQLVTIVRRRAENPRALAGWTDCACDLPHSAESWVFRSTARVRRLGNGRPHLSLRRISLPGAALPHAVNPSVRLIVVATTADLLKGGWREEARLCGAVAALVAFQMLNESVESSGAANQPIHGRQH